jgi:hypothetical protein
MTKNSAILNGFWYRRRRSNARVGQSGTFELARHAKAAQIAVETREHLGLSDYMARQKAN